jgi:hypothetical protein
MMKVDLYQMSGPFEQLLKRFEEAHESDKWAEGKASLFGWLGWGAIASLILCFVVAVYGEMFGLFFGAAFFAVVAVVMFVVRSRYKKFDLDDRKLAAVTQFLKIVSSDTGKDSPLKVIIDFRDYRTGGELLNQNKEGGGLFSYGVTIYKYAHRWFKIGGALLDGNRYEPEVTDRVTRKEKPKRKYTKVKERVASVLTLKLHFREDRYGNPQSVATALQQLQPPSGLGIKALNARGKNLSVVLAAPEMVTVRGRYGTDLTQPGLEVTGNTLLQVMLWAYDGIARGASTRHAA